MSQNKPENITVNRAIELIDEAYELYYKTDKDSQNNQYYEVAEKFKKAINILTKQEKLDKSHLEDLAISYINLGTLQLLLGQPNEALENSQKATYIYQQLNKPTEVSNSLILQAKALDKLSLSPRACNILIEALGIETKKNQQVIQQEIDSQSDKESCQNIELTPEMIQQVQQKFVNNNQSNYRKGLILLGNVLRKIGELNDSQIVLEEILKFTKEKKLQAAINFSLGDTLKAKGDLYYQRQSPPKYDYQPWKFYPRNLENLNNFQQDNQDTNQNCENAQQCYQHATIKYQNAIRLAKEKIELAKEAIKLDPLKEVKLTPLKEVYIKSQVKSLNLSLILGDIDKAEKLVSNINSPNNINSSDNIKLSDLPKTVSTVYTKINYAKSLAYLQQLKSQQIDQPNAIIDLVQNAIKDAEEIKNEYCSLKAMDFGKRENGELNSSEQYCLKYNRAESYALGNLGGLYEYLGDLQLAEQYTQKALYIAQPSEDPDLAYQWQWQLGRLFEAEGNREEAIANYEAAVETLESVRGDLLAINSDVQFNFRDNVEPLYRQLVAQLLPVGEENPPQENLKKALYYVDSLQLAELENFLQCDLQDVATVKIDRSSKTDERIEELFQGINQILDDYPTKAAFIYPILLEEQISVILKLPGEAQKLLYHQNKIDQESVQNTLKDALDNSLYSKGKFYQEKPLQKLYQWIIGKKFDNKLMQQKIKTLIFILDGDFRKIPMSALLDGKQFVVEKDYVTNVVPGVQLLKSQGSELSQLNALIVGATKERKDPSADFDSIKTEATEQIEFIIENLENIQILFQGELIKKPLDKFTKETLERELQKSFYEIVHIVAHGQFDSDPEKAFILTDDDSDYLLKINQLGRLLQTRDKLRPIELLFLSSCRTAEGDKRAVLGIAGIAVKSGARGTIAPLWNVNRSSSNILVKEFYKNLVKEQLSKAEALRRAQKSLRNKCGKEDGKEEDKKDRKNCKFDRPYHWAPFVLVGN